MSLTKNDRQNRSIHGKTIHAERFADALARALHREFDHTYAAIKTVVALTGANERAVRNWFDAKNGPSGEFLIALCRHSDQVLETFLQLAGRTTHLKAKKLVDAKQKLREILALVNELDAG
jgi:hypothetical protein